MLSNLKCIPLFVAVSCTAYSQIVPQPSFAQAQKETTAQLISELAQIESQSLGLDSAAIYDGFLGDERPTIFRMGVLGVPPSETPVQMKELVRRGPLALPELLHHLDDATPTKVKVGNVENGKPSQVGVNFFAFTYFSNEYDPRLRDKNRRHKYLEKDFEGAYNVKIGDVCFVLIGQIVNRRLLAVRYQPSAGLVINSPLQIPELSQEVKSDWEHADSEAIKNSLLLDARGGNRIGETADVNKDFRVFPALTRLRLYFPDTYTQLRKTDPELLAAFERRN